MHAVRLSLNHGHCPHPHAAPLVSLVRLSVRSGQGTLIYFRGRNKPKRGFPLDQLRPQQKSLQSQTPSSRPGARRVRLCDMCPSPPAPQQRTAGLSAAASPLRALGTWPRPKLSTVHT